MSIRNLFRPKIKEFKISVEIFHAGVTWPDSRSYVFEACTLAEAMSAAIDFYSRELPAYIFTTSKDTLTFYAE